MPNSSCRFVRLSSTSRMVLLLAGFRFKMLERSGAGNDDSGHDRRKPAHLSCRGPVGVTRSSRSAASVRRNRGPCHSRDVFDILRRRFGVVSQFFSELKQTADITPVTASRIRRAVAPAGWCSRGCARRLRRLRQLRGIEADVEQRGNQVEQLPVVERLAQKASNPACAATFSTSRNTLALIATSFGAPARVGDQCSGSASGVEVAHQQHEVEGLFAEAGRCLAPACEGLHFAFCVANNVATTSRFSAFSSTTITEQGLPLAQLQSKSPHRTMCGRRGRVPVCGHRAQEPGSGNSCPSPGVLVTLGASPSSRIRRWLIARPKKAGAVHGMAVTGLDEGIEYGVDPVCRDARTGISPPQKRFPSS